MQAPRMKEQTNGWGKNEQSIMA